MKRFIACCIAFIACATALTPASAADPAKVLRVVSADVSGFDPQQISDTPSAVVAKHIFEGLYEFDYLSTPAKIVPNTAAALPEIATDGLTWKIQLRSGILFSDDPAFKEKSRELVAEDYVYSIKRRLDPNLRGGGDQQLTGLLLGARDVVDAARRPGASFDYDAVIAGVVALDRHTLQLRLAHVDYTLLEVLAGLSSTAVAREVIEAAGQDAMAKPVGTGPYRLKEWIRSSRVVLEANPNYRSITFPSGSAADTKALASSMRDARLPAIGRIEVSIVDEHVPQLLAFDRGEFDYVILEVAQTIAHALSNGHLKPEYRKRGIQHYRGVLPTLYYTYFNMNDPTVGGYAPQRVALRRAIALGFDRPTLARVLFAGQATPAMQMLPPGVEGHDTSLEGKASYDPAAARALLDRFGYKDRDGDGFRESPDGKPLLLIQNSPPTAFARDVDALWISNMRAIGLKMRVNTAPFTDLLKQSAAGQLQMLNVGIRSPGPSGSQVLKMAWGQSPPEANRSRFRNDEYDAAYEAFIRTPPGPDRNTLARRMSTLVSVYVPFAFQAYPVGNFVVQPWIKGFYPSEFGQSWKYLDIDVVKQRNSAR